MDPCYGDACNFEDVKLADELQREIDEYGQDDGDELSTTTEVTAGSRRCNRLDPNASEIDLRAGDPQDDPGGLRRIGDALVGGGDLHPRAVLGADRPA